MLTWLMMLTAQAQFYHPEDIAQKSILFGQVSDLQVKPATQAMGTAKAYANALENYRISLALLGNKAPATEVKRLAKLEADFNRQFARLQTFADVIVEDTDIGFTDAMESAAKSIDPNAVWCESAIASAGPRVPGMAGRKKPNPACKGENLNAKIAAALDKDPGLLGLVEDLKSRKWPTVTLASTPQEPVGKGPYTDVKSFFVAAGPVKDQLRSIAIADDRAREEIEAALEQGADPASLSDKAANIAATTNGRYAASVEEFWPLLADKDVSWCANPNALGGCTGKPKADATDLWDEKKLAKALRKRMK